MNKVVGYVLAVIGIIGLAISSIPALTNVFSFLPQQFIKGAYFLIGCLIVVAVGLFLLFSQNKPKQPREVPIYDKEGKTIVCYRRMTTK